MPSVNGDWYRENMMYQVRDQIGCNRLQWNHKQFLRNHPSPGGHLLDIGCGTGEFLQAAQEADYQVTGFDFDSNAVRAAQERFGLNNVFTGDLAELAQKPGIQLFDVVTAFEVLEHSPTPGRFVQDLSRLVAPDRFLAISVPNRDRWPQFRYDWDQPPNHLTFWNQTSLTRLLAQNGFQILQTAMGWKQGEPFLHQHLQFGIVTQLLKNQRRQARAPVAGSLTEGAPLAGMAYRLKSMMISTLAIPVNLGLRSIGETGMTLYVLAQKTGGETR